MSNMGFFGKRVLQLCRNPSARGSRAVEQEQVSCLSEVSSTCRMVVAVPLLSPAQCLLPLNLGPLSSSEL